MKLAKQYYRLSDGTRKINCYHIAISKKALDDAGLNPKDDYKLKIKKGKIIIERKQ